MYKEVLKELIQAGNSEILQAAKSCTDKIFEKNKEDIFYGRNKFKTDKEVLTTIKHFQEVAQKNKINLGKLKAGELYRQVINPLYLHYVK